jgi:hypothetical protein
MKPREHREIAKTIIEHIKKSKEKEHKFLKVTGKIEDTLYEGAKGISVTGDIQDVLDELLNTNLLEESKKVHPVGLTMFRKGEKFEEIASNEELLEEMLNELFPDIE